MNNIGQQILQDSAKPLGGSKKSYSKRVGNLGGTPGPVAVEDSQALDEPFFHGETRAT
ncbi:MAG: hypothetical protein ACE5R6_19975 [Candidatus Heimdallarchaeota archaeon]